MGRLCWKCTQDGSHWFNKNSIIHSLAYPSKHHHCKSCFYFRCPFILETGHVHYLFFLFLFFFFQKQLLTFKKVAITWQGQPGLSQQKLTRLWNPSEKAAFSTSFWANVSGKGTAHQKQLLALVTVFYTDIPCCLLLPLPDANIMFHLGKKKRYYIFNIIFVI